MRQVAGPSWSGVDIARVPGGAVASLHDRRRAGGPVGCTAARSPVAPWTPAGGSTGRAPSGVAANCLEPFSLPFQAGEAAALAASLWPACRANCLRHGFTCGWSKWLLDCPRTASRLWASRGTDSRAGTAAGRIQVLGPPPPILLYARLAIGDGELGSLLMLSV